MIRTYFQCLIVIFTLTFLCVIWEKFKLTGSETYHLGRENSVASTAVNMDSPTAKPSGNSFGSSFGFDGAIPWDNTSESVVLCIGKATFQAAHAHSLYHYVYGFLIPTFYEIRILNLTYFFNRGKLKLYFPWHWPGKDVASIFPLKSKFEVDFL